VEWNSTKEKLLKSNRKVAPNYAEGVNAKGINNAKQRALLFGMDGVAKALPLHSARGLSP
jgi:hypothetical protein